MLERAKVGVSSVESLVVTRLYKSIQLTTNDWGCSSTRYELITNWVHPLFLKAKTEANRSRNPKLKAGNEWSFL